MFEKLHIVRQGNSRSHRRLPGWKGFSTARSEVYRRWMKRGTVLTLNFHRRGQFAQWHLDSSRGVKKEPRNLQLMSDNCSVFSNYHLNDPKDLSGSVPGIDKGGGGMMVWDWTHRCKFWSSRKTSHQKVPPFVSGYKTAKRRFIRKNLEILDMNLISILWFDLKKAVDAWKYNCLNENITAKQSGLKVLHRDRLAWLAYFP